MDYEQLFLKYKEEFTVENENISSRNVYRRLLKDLKTMILTTFIGQKVSKRNAKRLQNALYLVENELVNNPRTILCFTKYTKKPPLGYDRLIWMYQRKETTMMKYANLFCALKEIVVNYKNLKMPTLDTYIILQSLLEVATDTFKKDLDEYDKQVEEIEEAFYKGTMPFVTIIQNVEDLTDFVISVVCSDDALDFKIFQKALLKKEL